MRILVADDERFARTELLEALSAMNLPAETVIDAASDGVEAMDCVMRGIPDLLITDVRMPRCDGIALAQKVLELAPSCGVIFLSNYTDKPYLREAIRLHAVGYIDKPVDWVQLQSAVRQAIEAQTRTRQMADSLTRTVADARSMLLHRWTQVLSHKHSDCEAVRRQCEEYGVDGLFDTAYRCVLYHAEDAQLPELVLPGADRLPPTIQNDGTAVQYFYAHDAAALSDTALRTAWAAIPSAHRVGTAAGIVSPDYRAAFESYRSAVRTMDRLFFRTEPTLESAHDAPGDAMALDDASIAALEQPITDLNTRVVKARIDELFTDLHQKPATSVTGLRSYFCKLADHMLRISAADHLEFHHTHTGDGLYRAVWDAKNLDAIESTVRGWVRDMLACDYGDERVVRLTIAYIRHHYTDPHLDLSTICDYVGYSTSYMCPLFKKTVGVTMNRFLTDTRMEHARRMLTETESSLDQIARACGYTSAKYFGRAFKAATHQSPGEFRLSTERKRAQED